MERGEDPNRRNGQRSANLNYCGKGPSFSRRGEKGDPPTGRIGPSSESDYSTSTVGLGRIVWRTL